MPDICPISAYVKHKKRPRRSRASSHNREVDSGLSMLANNCSRQAFSNMFVLRAPIFVWVRFAFEHVRLRPKTKKNEHAPPEGGRGFWAHYSPLVPVLGFVGVIRESDWVVWLVFRCDIDHTALCFFHDFA